MGLDICPIKGADHICFRASWEGTALHKPLGHGRVQAALVVPAGLGDLLGMSAAPFKMWLVAVPPGLGQVWLQDIILVPTCCDAFSQRSCWLLWLRWGGAQQCPAGTLHEVGRRLEGADRRG